MPLEQEFDTGAGTGGLATIRTLTDSTQLVTPGIKDALNSMPVVQAGLKYQFVPSSSSSVTIGAGAVGDYIAGILCTWPTVSPGPLTIIDGASSIILFPGGTNSIPNTLPFLISLGMVAQNSGGWKVTTTSGISAIVIGKF